MLAFKGIYWAMSVFYCAYTRRIWNMQQNTGLPPAKVNKGRKKVTEEEDLSAANVVDEWNSLPVIIIDSVSVNQFKKDATPSSLDQLASTPLKS